MSPFKREVKAIIANQDVRDPRATLLAIERLLDAKITGVQKPVLSIKVFSPARPDHAAGLSTSGLSTYSVSFKGLDTLENKARVLECVSDSLSQVAMSMLADILSPARKEGN